MTDFPKGKVAFLVTGNVHKFNEARQVLSEYGLAAAMLGKIEAIEIQDDSIENVARTSVIDAVKKCDLPVMVEDAGLFVEALKDFPGPYSSYMYRTIGNEGLLKLMENVLNRKAWFKSVVAFLGPSISDPLCFIGEVGGQIALEQHGSQGFGFDPVFKPSGSSKTFAQMSMEEKNKRSHRASAFRKFAKWYTASF